MVDVSGGSVYLSGTVQNSLTIPNILAIIVFEAVKTRIKLEIQEQRDSQMEHTFRVPIDDNSDQILFIIKGCDLNVTVTDNRGNRGNESLLIKTRIYEFRFRICFKYRSN